MSRYRATMKELLEKVYKEDGHQDVSSSKRMCRTIREDAQQIESKLNTMSPEDSLDTWWTNKLAVSANNLNKARDYIVNDVKEELELDEGKMKTIATMFDQGQSAKEIAKALKLPISTVKSILGEGINPYVSMQKDDKTGRTKYVVLDKDEKEAFSSFEYKVAQDYMKKNYNKLKEQLDEKIADSIIKDLQKAYGDLKGKTISPEMANKISKHLDGQSFDVVTLRQLMKAKIPFISTIARNKIYKKTGKFEEIEEATYDPTMFGPDKVAKAMAIATKSSGRYSVAVRDIEKIAKNLSKVSTIARELKKQNESIENPMSKEEPKKDNEKKEAENKDKQIAALKDQISMLKTKIENEKNKAVKPEPNPDTGEVPLTVGVAYKHFKDKAKKEVKEESLEEMSPAEKKKRLQRAKDMIKYYDMMKKRALKGPNKALAKKMLKSELEEATKNTDFKVKMKTPSGMKTVRVTVPIKDFVVDMAKIEDAARKKVKGDMVNFDFVGDIKMEADLTKSQIKQVHKVADDLPKKDFKDRYGKEKGDAVRFGTATNIVKKKLGIEENTSAFNPTVHNKTLGVTTKDLDRAFKKLSNQAQTYVNELLRTGMGTRDAIKKAKQKFNENNISEDRRLYVETIAGLKKKAEKSGMPYSILKKVYDRGMAAWKSGHRPGASQQQWAFARVNSFVTKSSGTWGGADKDLAKQVRGSK